MHMYLNTHVYTHKIKPCTAHALSNEYIREPAVATQVHSPVTYLRLGVIF